MLARSNFRTKPHSTFRCAPPHCSPCKTVHTKWGYWALWQVYWPITTHCATKSLTKQGPTCVRVCWACAAELCRMALESLTCSCSHVRCGQSLMERSITKGVQCLFWWINVWNWDPDLRMFNKMRAFSPVGNPLTEALFYSSGNQTSEWLMLCFSVSIQCFQCNYNLVDSFHFRVFFHSHT